MRLKGTLLLTVVAIGINVTLVSGYGSCCHYVKAMSQKYNRTIFQRGYFGYYTMQAGFVNGKAHFSKDDDKSKAIWYSGDSWVLGKKSELGKDSGYFSVSSRSDCPYIPEYWYYLDQYRNWRYAAKSFSILSHC